MAWVKLHDGAMQDLKISGLSDSAFRLWIRGLCYCQTALTDGLIPHSALRDMGAKRKDVDELATPVVPGRAPLWERIDQFGFKVHDYLDWNDSREKVQARKLKAKDRKTAFEERKKHTHTNAVPNAVLPASAGFGLVCSSDSEDQERGSGGKPAPPAKPDPFTNATITERAGRFIERYEELYLKHRKARYLVIPGRDYNSAVRLCETWTDDARLDKLAAIFLTTDNEFAVKGSRTLSQFAALASWCDGKLAEWEHRQGVA